VEVSVETSASAEQLWQAWTEVPHVVRWLADDASGVAQAGDRISWHFQRFGMHMTAEVLVAEPPRKLLLRAAPSDREPTLLELHIEQRAETTTLKLINSGFSSDGDSDELIRTTASGWLMALAMLKHYVENHFGEDRSSFISMSPADFAHPRLKEYFRTGAGLARWLTTSGVIGPQGSAFELRLRDGSILSGRVLRITPRGEVMLSCSEINGVIELKGFRIGSGPRMVCLRGCGWGLPPERAKDIEAQLDAAVLRLAKVLDTQVLSDS